MLWAFGGTLSGATARTLGTSACQPNTVWLVNADDAEAAALLARWGIKRGMTDKQAEMNLLWTSVLDSLLLFLLPVLLLIGADILSKQGVQCDTCDPQIAVGSMVLVAGLLTVLLLTVAVSVVLLIRRQPATYVPVAGGFVMVACVVVTAVISGYPFR